MSILKWFGLGKVEKFTNVVKANAEVARLRTMVANIPQNGVSTEDYLDVKEAYNLLKAANEKLITMNEELIAEVHLATAKAEADVSTYKKAVEDEKVLLAKSMAEVIEDKKKLEMSINQKAAELISSMGCSVGRLPTHLTENEIGNKSAYTIKTI